MKRVLVTGANGQLGRCIKDASTNFDHIVFVFCSRQQLDIDHPEALKRFFENQTFDYCINTAAYTNVEKAESETDKAFQTNAEAVSKLANICQENDITLLHVSTDYVFDGEKRSPYLENDLTNPLNVYGSSKLKGEEYITELCEKFFIVRTSWLYSQYGHNFFNTILNYAKQGKPLTITTEQTGVPTNANDMALALLNIITENRKDYGIFHFSNLGKATWFDFAEEILMASQQFEATNLVKTDHYRTFAIRPKFSVLDTQKYSDGSTMKILDWRKSLRDLVHQINI